MGHASHPDRARREQRVCAGPGVVTTRHATSHRRISSRSPAQAQLLLDAAETGATLVQGTAALLTDGFQHFDFVEADQLTLDGCIAFLAWGSWYRPTVAAWAGEMDIDVITDGPDPRSPGQQKPRAPGGRLQLCSGLATTVDRTLAATPDRSTLTCRPACGRQGGLITSPGRYLHYGRPWPWAPIPAALPSGPAPRRAPAPPGVPSPLASRSRLPSMRGKPKSMSCGTGPSGAGTWRPPPGWRMTPVTRHR